MNELTFSSLIDANKLELKSLFSNAGKYDCPCRRKKMSTSDWKNYKNSYMQKIWQLLHETSFKYLDHPTEEEEKKVFNFFNTDVKRIPCSTCRAHYNEYLKTRDLKEEVKSKIKLVKWLIDLHNNVNKSNNKSSMSYKEVFELYNEDYNEYNEGYKIYTFKVEPVIGMIDAVTGILEPAKLEPAKLEPAKLEPVKLEPVKLEPVKVEPVKLEPVKVESIESDKKYTVKRENIIGLKPIDTDINVRFSKFNTQLNRIINKKEPMKVEPTITAKKTHTKREHITGLKPIDTNINVRLSKFNTQLNRIVNKKVDNNNSYQDDRSHFSFSIFRSRK